MPSYSVNVTPYKNHMRGHCDYILREEAYNKENLKQELVYHASGNMPSWTTSPVEFFKEAELRERKNGRPYTGIMVALPEELSLEDNVAIVEEMIETLGIKKNHAYTYAIHDKVAANDPEHRNVHVHIMFSERIIDHQKAEEPKDTYFLRYSKDEQNNVTQGQRKADWSKKEKILHIRKVAADVQNKYLEKNNIAKKVSEKSLKKQKEEAIIQGDFTQAMLLTRETHKRMSPYMQYSENGKAFIEACRQGSIEWESLIESSDEEKNAFLYVTQQQMKQLKKAIIGVDNDQEKFSMQNVETLAFLYKEQRELLQDIHKSVEELEKKKLTDKDIENIVFASVLKKKLEPVQQEIVKQYEKKKQLLKMPKNREIVGQLQAINKKIKTLEIKKKTLQHMYAKEEPYASKIEERKQKIKEKNKDTETLIQELLKARKKLIKELMIIRKEYWSQERMRKAETYRNEEIKHILETIQADIKNKIETKQINHELKVGYRSLKKQILTDKEIQQKAIEIACKKEFEPLMIEKNNIESNLINSYKKNNKKDIETYKKEFEEWKRNYRYMVVKLKAMNKEKIDKTIESLTIINNQRKDNLKTVYEARKTIMKKIYAYHQQNKQEKIKLAQKQLKTKQKPINEEKNTQNIKMRQSTRVLSPLLNKMQKNRPSLGETLQNTKNQTEATYHTHTQREETEEQRKERELLEGRSNDIGM